MKKFILPILLIAVAAFAGYLKFTHQNLSLINFWATAQRADISWGSPEYTKNLNDLLDIVKNQDPRKALHELASRMQTNATVFHNCHIIAHSLGRAGFEKYQDFNTALEYQDTTCSDGYLHGVIEGRFASLKDTPTAITDLKTICSKYAHKDRCWHGTGHGLMFFTHNDLPKALGICNTYSVSRAQSRCYEGVFMENFLSDPDAHPSIYLDAQNPSKPCLAQSARYRGTCYFYVPIYYLGLHNNDYAATLAWCAGSGGYSATCVRGTGSLAMKYNIDNPVYVEQLCMATNSAYVHSCIDGMTSYYFTFTGSLSKVSQLCTQLKPSNAATCNAAVRRNAALF